MAALGKGTTAPGALPALLGRPATRVLQDRRGPLVRAFLASVVCRAPRAQRGTPGLPDRPELRALAETLGLTRPFSYYACSETLYVCLC